MRLVCDAFTKPELVKQWLLGSPGWSIPICEIDLRVGGAYRYLWRRDSDGSEMGMGGVYREIAAPERLVATEKFERRGIPVRQSARLSSLSKAERPRSHRRCST